MSGLSIDGDAAYVNAILNDTKPGDSTVLDYGRMTFEVVTQDSTVYLKSFNVTCLKCKWNSSMGGESATLQMARHIDTGHFKTPRV